MIAFTTLAVALSVLPSAFAQKQYTVQVGAGGQIKYDPEFINDVNPGDFIDFVFNPKNHTVTQSSFAFPCQAVDNAIRSGFVPVAAGASPITKRLIVPASVSSGPLWFYCGQTGHCGQGMVFALNPPATGNTFEAFKAKAIADFGPGATATPTFTTPPPPAFSTATTVVSSGTSTWTTTYTSYVGSTVTPVPAANPVDHKITVGANGQLAFSPANITANVGDTVTFEFHPKNHTVTQSSFANPCVRLSGDNNVQGFASGFRPVASDDGDLPTFQIKVNDTAPIWGYCGQTGHCARGMVFSINAIESGPNNFATFQQLATQQGGDAPNAGGDFSASPTTPGGPGNTNTPGGNNTGTASVSKGMSGALVLGAVVMGIVGFAL